MAFQETFSETNNEQPLRELSGPFRTSAHDYVWLADAIPALREIALVNTDALAAMEQSKEKINSQLILHKSEALGLEASSATELPMPVQDRLNQVLRAGAAFLSTVEREEDRSLWVRELLDPYFGHLNSDHSSAAEKESYTFIINSWTSDLLRGTRVRTAYDQASDQMQDFSDSLAAGTLDDQYRVLKIVGDTEELQDEEGGAAAQTDFLLAAAMYAHRTGTPDIASVLTERLQTGTYDQYVARDLLQFVSGGLPEQFRLLQPLTQAYRLIRKVTRDKEDAEVIHELAYSVNEWTPEMLLPVRRAKENMLLAAAMASRWAVHTTEKAGLTIPHDQGQAFKREMQNFTEAQNPGVAAARRLIQQYTVPDPRFQEKPRQQTSVQETVPTQEVIIPQRRLVVIAPDGTEHERGSERFNRMLTSNITIDRGSRLGEAVETILDFMSTKLDFSQGLPNGVKKYDDMVTEDGRLVPVYGFKPKDASGLSTSSKQKVDIRILFSLFKQTEQDETESIEILGVAFRDKIGTLAHRLGIKY